MQVRLARRDAEISYSPEKLRRKGSEVASTSLAQLFKLKVKQRRGRITTLRYPVRPEEGSCLVLRPWKDQLLRDKKLTRLSSFRFEGRVIVNERRTARWMAKWLRK